ncbi:hypothetical protein IEO21_05343 [Rhodonia placenta]|uniref:Nudix hydrolase domain-containing protein n=1 Tax=Rhodonia placenta TaxID=104341 RepID=A0A8H7P218_9APHY|nr:hypothetical protein IEO21_05343 [Postia placenta]
MLRTFATTSIPSPAPLSSGVRISLTAPLSRSALSSIRTGLEFAFSEQENVFDPAETHAAVLIPFCNVNNVPGILFEVRGKLRTHSGEVSFPGGRMDEAYTLSAALRETEEEIGIPRDRVEILGRLGPPQTSLSGLRVWPYAGFVHAESRPFSMASGTSPVTYPPTSESTDDFPLPSLSLADLKLNPQEVAHAFHLPLTALVSPPRLHSYLFRGGLPYYAVSVADIVAGPGAVHSDSDAPVHWVNDIAQRDEIGGGREGRLEVWGLTGWYLCEIMRILGVYRPHSTERSTPP